MWRASVLRGSMLDSYRYPPARPAGTRQQWVAFLRRGWRHAGSATLALSADDSTLAARQKPPAAQELGGLVLAALRNGARALAALYRGAPPPARAKVLAQRGASAVFVQLPSASSLAAQASHATELVGRSRRAIPRVPLTTSLESEAAIESSGPGPPPAFLADETAIESCGSGPPLTFLVDETGTESCGWGPPPMLLAEETGTESCGWDPPPRFLADETATELSGLGPPPMVLAEETETESCGSGPPPTLGLQPWRESSLLRVATSTLRAPKELTRALRGPLWAPGSEVALLASRMLTAPSAIRLSQAATSASKPLRVPLPQSWLPQRASGVLSVWVSAALLTRQRPVRGQRRFGLVLLRRIARASESRLHLGTGQEPARGQRRGPDDHRGPDQHCGRDQRPGRGWHRGRNQRRG